MTAEERFGNAVWDGLVACCEKWVGYMSVGEIAKEAGVSRPTAAKYLDRMTKMGRVKCIDTTKRKLGKGKRKFYRAEGM
jgi:Mn-dependent DtxR family transcriptional regulator